MSGHPRLAALAPIALFLAAPALVAAQAVHPDPEPRFYHHPGLTLVRPDRTALVNADGTPRVLSDDAYDRFWREVAPSLEVWARDPRLAINPAFVAALLAKESGYEPFATSAMPANGYPQLTHIADADMLQIAREAPAWHWILDELERWPRHPLVHRPDATEALTDSLVTAGAVHAGNEYFFDPLTATRGAVFWLRILAQVWSTDEFPGRYGTFARARLANGAPLPEPDLLDLVTVSYNQGYTYVHDLVDRFGPDWTHHLNPEAQDYLERIRAYARNFEF